ncbi:hypothetical protein GALL_415930 [mine drainage metagenome]|uniref:AlgX/AlgJ SGNH hydrolase-like domain-containing protein n=1 Tax=mine drainage metagenome TaxID=410659 RepID=A0A1J5PZ19_9ZZZZ
MMDRNIHMNKIEIRALIALFGIAISLPLLTTFWNGAGGRFNDVEKRKLAERPPLYWTREGFNKFSADFTKYFDDNFGGREKFIKLHSYIQGAIFGISPAKNAIIGKQGWLFLGDGNVVADYRHTHPFTDGELKLWRDSLVAKRDWLSARGIKYLFVVAPDKHSIYPEFMPDYLNQVRSDSCLDQLLAYLKANSNIQILDLRPALWAEKASVRLYHKTDTHWNERGAFVAYQQIMQRLSQNFPEMQARTLTDFQPVEEIAEGQDIANMMDLRSVMHEKVLRLEPKAKPCARAVNFKLSPDFKWPAYPPGHEAYARECNKKKIIAVFFQDSFGTALVPYISEHFKRTTFIWDYPSYAVMNATVQQEHPDVVIEERVERHLKAMMPDFDIPSGLVGMWTSNSNKVEIKHLSSSSIYLTNEHGLTTIGLISGSKVDVKGWGVVGDVSTSKNKIAWSNGTSWTR